jgi:hypothetical protein
MKHGILKHNDALDKKNKPKMAWNQTRQPKTQPRHSNFQGLIDLK